MKPSRLSQKNIKFDHQGVYAGISIRVLACTPSVGDHDKWREAHELWMKGVNVLQPLIPRVQLGEGALEHLRVD